MKLINRLLLTLMLTCTIGMMANAQIHKGTLMIGTTVGSTGYSDASSDYTYDNGNLRNTSNHGFTISAGPQIGIFLTQRLALGGNLSFNYSHAMAKSNTETPAGATSGTNTTTSTGTISVGPFVRYYFSNLTSRNWFYAQVNGAAGSGTGSTDGGGFNAQSSNTTSGKTTGIFNWNAGGSVGLTHFVSQKIGMDFALGYAYNHQKSRNEAYTYTKNDHTGIISTTNNNYDIQTATHGLTAAVGFHFFL